MMKSVQMLCFLKYRELTITLVDRDARAIASIIRLEETVFTVVCRGPVWFHPNVVSVPVT